MKARTLVAITDAFLKNQREFLTLSSIKVHIA